MLSESDFTFVMKTLEEARRKGLNYYVADGVNPKVRKKKVLRCRWPWEKFYISVDGTVSPCCYALPDRGVVFGNVFQENVSKIWNHTGYREFRKELKRGMPTICRNSPDYSFDNKEY